MPQFTTGELAKACGVSVRTVQFYDAKELLKPSGLSQGGRRLYSDGDLETLRLICMLKTLGLALTSIKGILESEHRGKVLLLLLDEQARSIGDEIADRQKQLESIKVIQNSIRNLDTLPVHSISDIEHMMNSQKKLRNTHAAMIVLGILMDLIQLAAILLWIFRGIWLPFAIGMPIVILMGLLMTRLYHRNTAFICAQCGTHFRPPLRKLLFSGHTPKTRLLQCPKCAATGYCVETGADDGKP
jgi:DNA-binding transcriptional MerR regulator